MGHYMNVLVENGEQAKFPSIEASIIPFVWLKQGTGTLDFAIMYTQSDKPVLQYIAASGEEYEKQVAQDVLYLLADNDNITVSIELSTGSGKLLYEMLLQILPYKVIFKNHRYEVFHDHETKQIN
jgi:hypothetical protein